MSFGFFWQVFFSSQKLVSTGASWHHLVRELFRADMMASVSDYKAKEKKLFLCWWQQQISSDESIPYCFSAKSQRGWENWLSFKGVNNYWKTHRWCLQWSSSSTKSKCWQSVWMTPPHNVWLMHWQDGRIEIYLPNQFLLCSFFPWIWLIEQKGFCHKFCTLITYEAYQQTQWGQQRLSCN